MWNAQNKSNQPVYFFGCDMGGWHNKETKKGDALAVCKWTKGGLKHVEATANLTFFPVAQNSPLEKHISSAIEEQAKIFVAIDAALSWPTAFTKLVKAAPNGDHEFSFKLDSAIQNPYLYRETERFIKEHVLTGNKERPLTAVGDKFGNNSSKAQALVAWSVKRLATCYRPPFDLWDRGLAQAAQYSIIEVYPAASKKSKRFNTLHWPQHKQTMEELDNSDIADAKRCAMTAVCYAAEISSFDGDLVLPKVYCPDHSLVASSHQEVLKQEGWIFAPFDS